MRLTHLSIRNFRGIASLSLTLGSESLLLVGANGAGKSAVLTAAAKAFGVDRGMSVEDFVDPSQPVEITATLSDLGSLVGDFNAQAAFGPGGPTVTLGVHASVDGPEVEVVHGFPSATWSRASRAQLRALPVLSLSAARDHARLLRLTGSTSLMAKLITELDLSAPLDTAGQAVAQAAADLVQAQPLQDLLASGSAELTKVLADAGSSAFALGSGPPLEMLRELQLTLGYGGRRAAIGQQPSGLAHLAVFAIALVAMQRQPGSVVLVDEPELSLHPHAQRALIGRLRGSDAQLLIATHSAHALARLDLRQTVRLQSGPAGTTAHKASHVSDVEERRLARYATADLTEAFFASTAVLVEGVSDRLALRIAAETLGVDLDARGVSIVELNGAGLFATMLELLGMSGLGIRVIGLCDADHEQQWAGAVLGPGVYNGDRSVLAQHEVYVFDPDIEGALVDALGEQRVEALIAADGEAQGLAAFRQQPSQQQYSPREQLVRFVKKGKARWPPMLMGDMADTEVPHVIRDLINSV
jgi:energy-coupling factor transporter ATP-binding protein EcfA2